MTADDGLEPRPFPEKVAAKIKARRAFYGAGLIGYTTAGGSYLLAADDGQHRVEHDLLLIQPDDEIVKLRITASPDLIHRTKDALGIEWRRCPAEHPLGERADSRGGPRCIARKGHVLREKTSHITMGGAIFKDPTPED